jgi:hypothetical protein
MSNALDAAFAQQNTYAVTQVLNSVLGTLNSVDCTVTIPCHRLNRLVCKATAKTCGPCLTGFLGVKGDANIACQPAAILKLPGEPCQSNSSCLSGLCMMRSAGNVSICADISKICPNNCGGESNGRCTYQDSNGNKLSQCSISNPLCQATCVCSIGRFGRDCSLNAASLTQFKTLRTTMCAALAKNIRMRTLTADVVESRATTIAGILMDLSQVSRAALINCTHVLVDTVLAATDLCGGNTASIVLHSLSDVLRWVENLPRKEL